MTQPNIKISKPFEVTYDCLKKELSIFGIEADSGSRTEVRFDGPATRVLYDLLLTTGAQLGEPLGDETALPSMQ
ncbi:hypothetical protein [Paraburkholderia caribensis]|uniref:hypothetical protein n=1 Tax=Paraburkholderia caribensis TaxID=75105 RepID=UPI0034D24264